MPECKFCLNEKEISEFVMWYGERRDYCKKCHTSKYYIRKIHSRDPTSKSSKKYSEWKKAVKERDAYKCQKCDAVKNLHAHHIVPWKTDINLRFEIDNGITLCGRCHIIEEPRHPYLHEKSIATQFKKGHISWRKGLTGFTAWNKGIKLLPHQIGGKETQFKKGYVSPWKGKKRDLPENCKATQFKKGESASPETQFKKGQPAWNKGLKMSKGN